MAISGQNTFVMKKLLRVLKIFSYGILILLASIGMGINSAILPTFRKNESVEPTIEVVEATDDENDLAEIKEKE